MSYEMKDILKTMIDNNEPHWSADTMDMVRVEIHNVYSQASKADEYEAKAKAFDRIVKELKITEFDIYEKELVDERRGLLSFGREISRFLNEYESGGSDD